MRKTLKKIALQSAPESANGIIKLLLADHRLLRKLMKQVKSNKATDSKIQKSFKELIKTQESHVSAEEHSFYDLIKNNPKFEDHVFEGIEEHRVHENVARGIAKVSDKKRRIQQMKIYCEFLEHHLDEEEEEIFPKFKKYAAASTRRKLGAKFLKIRKRTNSNLGKRGALSLASTRKKRS